MKIKKINGGFTLIELMIVMVIITLLTVTVVSSVRRQGRYLQYDEAILNVNGLIKEARSFALTSRPVFDESQPPGQESYVPVGGYGVYIERNPAPAESTVILFANTDTSGEGVNQYSDDDLIEEQMMIPNVATFNELEVIDLDPAEVRTAVNRAVILFAPATADTLIATNDDPANSPLAPATAYDTLEMSFYRTQAGPTSPSRTISINRTAGFSEIE